MQKISPCLWFDGQAEEAANFYVSVFRNSKTRRCIMSDFNGKFVWYELMTSDPKAAEAFYCNAIGWTAKDAGMPTGMSYTLLLAGGIAMGGMMAVPPEAAAAGLRPMWGGYVAVDDVDDYAQRITHAGGAIHKAPTDIPGVGRFAVAADLQGAIFMMIKGLSDTMPQPPAPDAPGHVGWRELHAGDSESAFAFYSGLFGWTKAEAVDMGSMGIYQTFATGDGPAVGGMMKKTDSMPRPVWLYYFNVAGIDAAIGRVKDGGGQVLNGPMQVPGGSWIAQCFDPQGAMFAMVGPRG